MSYREKHSALEVLVGLAVAEAGAPVLVRGPVSV